jgi:hypothetical protein
MAEFKAWSLAAGPIEECVQRRPVASFPIRRLIVGKFVGEKEKPPKNGGFA